MRNKFNAVPKVYKGVKYHSTKEADYAKKLDILKKAKKIISWERQLPIKLLVNDALVCTYVMDFVAKMPDGHKQYIEVKGYKTNVWRLKWKLLLALKSEIDPTGEFVVV